MALSPQLLQFKSSGVYRLEFDKSQTVNIPAETIRLVVGRSKKGPYNTPVLVEDIEQFTQVFGGIDKSLEKKNMFFHRSAIECLSRGPILAMNLTTADDNDKVSLVSPATNSGVEGLQSVPANNLPQNRVLKKYSEVFDTDKFWTPSDLKLLEAADQDTNHAISFCNIKQDPISVIIRQAGDVRGFEVQAREWFGEANIPEGIDPAEYVSDYMVDVFIFKGRFDPAELNNDPTYGEFFTSKGLEKDQLAKFVGLREVTLVAQYTGSLIPEFMDNEGRQLYIETLINLEARRTGLFCAIQEDALTQIDLIGKGFNPFQDYEILSHRVEQVVTPNNVDLSSFNGKVQVNGNELEIRGDQLPVGETLSSVLAALPNPIVVGKWLNAEQDGEYVQITDIQNVPGAATGAIQGKIIANGNIDQSIGVYEHYEDSTTPASWNADVQVKVNEDGNLVFSAAPDNLGDIFFEPNADGGVTWLLSENSGEYLAINNINNSYNDPEFGAGSYLVSPAGSLGFSSTLAGNGTILAGVPFGGKKSIVTASMPVNNLEKNARVLDFTPGWTVTNPQDGTFKFFKDTTLGDDFNKDIKVGMYVPGENGNLSRILKIVKTVNGNVTNYEFTTSRKVIADPTYALKRYEDAAGVYKMFAFDGATQSDKKIGGNTGLLSAIKPGTGLGNALVDKDNITFRYVVDTFGSLEDGGILNKEELTFLCKERQNASAILNAPMVKELKASVNPSFLNEITGALDLNNVATGGNLNLNPSALYTLPSINEGATYGFYYGPGLNVIENGRTKCIPPAAYVSNNYIDKFSDALPWSIIAGPRRGVVGGTGVQSLEFAFDKSDRDVLEPFGYNPIVFERGVGLTIKGNKTAQQGIQSALSSAHVREVLIFIEDGLAEILKNYLFEFNNAQTRLEIKTLADNFMESVKKDGGVFDYRNIMDTSNNTNDVIDNNMGILDTFVEPVKGLEILVSRVTVLNTGEIASGNFA